MNSPATIRLWAAGSLRSALAELASAFQSAHRIPVALVCGPSGLLRERIERGEAAHVFASADLAHPQRLSDDGRAGPVAVFARNRLCALTLADCPMTTTTLLDTLLDPAIRIGTSTPGADPSGDYAWEMFRKADALRAGARQVLEVKAQRLTGSPSAPVPPPGRTTYGWLMEEGRVDVFLTYRTNALLAREEVPALRIVELPRDLSVAADYGLTVINGAPAQAEDLARHLLSAAARRVLARHGFGVARPLIDGS